MMKLTGLPAIRAGHAPPAAVSTASQSHPRVIFGRWAFMVAAVATLGFTVAFAFPADFDYWWHLANGRYMVAERALPVPDPFSFTAAGRTWVNHSWLPELAMYGLYRSFGVAGPAMLFGLCMAAAVLLTLSTLRRLGTRLLPSVVWTIVMILAMVPYMGPRPHLAAFALMAAVLWLLERWVARRDRGVWALPALFLLWGNVHGSFVVGLAVPAVLFAGELLTRWLRWGSAPRLSASDLRRLALALAASVAALLVNPNGLALLLYPATKLHNPLLRYIEEWNPTDITAPMYWPFALLVGTYVALVVVRRPQLPATDLLMASAFIAGGLWGMRFVPFAALCLVVLIGRVLTRPNESGARAPRLVARMAAWRDARARRETYPTTAKQWVNALAVLLLIGVLAIKVRPFDAPQDDRLPVAAVDTLGAEGLPGPLFNDYSWGGYLIWRLWPETRVFIDGRADDLYMSGGQFRDYLNVIYVQADGDQVLERYGIQTVLYEKDTPLVRYLLADGNWQTTYDDGRVVKLERRR